MTTTHNSSDARMTAQAPYESLTSVDAVLDAQDAGREVEFRADYTEGNWRVLPRYISLDAIENGLTYGYEYRAALLERAPVSAGGDAGGVMDLSAPPRVWLQVDTDGDPDDRSEAIPPEAWDQLTWHYEPIGGQEVVYVRQDLATPAPPVGADWVIWRGGECPVAKDVRVDYLMRNALEGYECSDLAGDLNWNHGDPTLGSASEIIAFRARAAAPTPAEARGVGDDRWPATYPGYTRVFNAICAATRPEWGGKATAVSVESFMSALAANKPDTRQAQAQGSEGWRN